jgi:hypothetical protein
MDAKGNVKMKQDVTLSDYIKRISDVIKQESNIKETVENKDDYKVYPETEIDSDYKRNPYSSV